MRHVLSLECRHVGTRATAFHSVEDRLPNRPQELSERAKTRPPSEGHRTAQPAARMASNGSHPRPPNDRTMQPPDPDHQSCTQCGPARQCSRLQDPRPCCRHTPTPLQIRQTVRRHAESGCCLQQQPTILCINHGENPVIGDTVKI